MDLDAEYSEYKAYVEEFAKTIDPVSFSLARDWVQEFTNLCISRLLF